MPETYDLRSVPLSHLSKQEISSRLHLIRDEQVRLAAEQLELKRMENALMEEMWSRND